MQIKKSLLVAGAVTTVGLASLAGVNTVSAATDTTGDSLVSKLAQKFNVGEDEVQAVFDEDKQARQAEMRTALSERLQEAVDDGDITAAQKTLIENKRKELQAARDTERDALDAWATEQGIDAKYLMMGRGPADADDDRLQDAVDDGDITAEQKAAIEAKRAEIQEARDATRDKLEQWVEDNDIDTQYLRMGGGKGMHGPGGRQF
jgi:hypothetical protein